MIDFVVCVVMLLKDYCDSIDCLDVILIYMLVECFKYI